MLENKKRKFVYIVLEVVYAVTMLVYLNNMLKTYSFSTTYQLPLETILKLILLIFILLFGALLNKIIVFIYQFLISAYFISQSVYQESFGSYWRINYALSLKDEMMGVKDSVAEFLNIQLFYPIILLSVVTIVFIVLYFLFQRKTFKYTYLLPIKLSSLILVFFIVSSHNKFLSLLEDSKYSINTFQMNKTDYYIYETMPSANEFINKFGLITFAYRDITGFYENDINRDDAILQISSFFDNKEKHQSNYMSGIFEGKNVVLIQAESFVDYAVDPDLTPNIYKFKNEGINFSNFDTPLLPGSTSDTEFMANTSLIPYSADGSNCYKYPYNTYKTTLPLLFKDKGYRAEIAHNCYGEYYNRDLVFSLLGYDKFWDCTDLGFEDCVSDKDVGSNLAWMYAEKDYNWLLYWITYSGHQPYDYDSVGVNQDNIDRILVKYPDLDINSVSYLSKNMDLDQAIGEIIYALECYNKLDETVFVFFGDHFAKGLDFEGQNQTDLFIYNSEIEPIINDNYGTVLDLLPTIANLWNMDLDNKTILGSDLFDEDYKGFCFDDWGRIETKDFVYNALENLQIIKTDISKNEMLNFVNYFESLKETSRGIIKYNYFAEE